jgi:outer membrane autotransporter protein
MYKKVIIFIILIITSASAVAQTLNCSVSGITYTCGGTQTDNTLQIGYSDTTNGNHNIVISDDSVFSYTQDASINESFINLDYGNITIGNDAEITTVFSPSDSSYTFKVDRGVNLLIEEGAVIDSSAFNTNNFGGKSAAFWLGIPTADGIPPIISNTVNNYGTVQGSNSELSIGFFIYGEDNVFINHSTGVISYQNMTPDNQFNEFEIITFLQDAKVDLFRNDGLISLDVDSNSNAHGVSIFNAVSDSGTSQIINNGTLQITTASTSNTAQGFEIQNDSGDATNIDFSNTGEISITGVAVTDTGNLNGAQAGSFSGNMTFNATNTGEINVTNSATISGGRANAFSFYDFNNVNSGSEFNITNSGEVNVSSTNGIASFVIISGFSITELNINNSGTVNSTSENGTAYAVRVYQNGCYNLGSLSDPNRTCYVVGDNNSVENITNSGTIYGDYLLEGGNDTIINSGYLYSENIFTGSGDDTITLNIDSTFAFYGNYDGGSGADTLNIRGNSGDLTIYSNTGCTSTTCANNIEILDLESSASVILSGSHSFSGDINADSSTLKLAGATLSSSSGNTDIILVNSILSLLNDGSGNVSNVSVDGGLTMNSSSSLLFDLGNTSTSTDNLTFGDNVTLDGSIVVTSNYNHEIGNSYELISTSGTLSGTFDNVTLPSAYNWLQTYDSNSYSISVVNLDCAGNPSFNQNSVCNAFYSSSSSSSDYNTLVGTLNSLSDPEFLSAMDDLSAEYFASQINADNKVVKEVHSILRERVGERVFKNNKADKDDNFWIKITGSKANIEGKNNYSGYLSNSFTQTVGIDREYKDNKFFGLAFTMAEGNIDWDKNSTSSDNKSYYISGYYTLIDKDIYYDFVVSAGRLFHDTNKEISFGGINKRANSGTSGYVFSASIEAGKTIKTKYFDIVPQTIFGLSRAYYNSFVEHGANAANLAVDSHHITNANLSFGPSIVKEFKYSNYTFFPSFRSHLTKDFSNSDGVQAVFLEDSTQQFTSKSVSNDNFTYENALGLTIKAYNTSLYSYYKNRYNIDYVENIIYLGAKFEF